jgi:hypothetical protein
VPPPDALCLVCREVHHPAIIALAHETVEEVETVAFSSWAGGRITLVDGNGVVVVELDALLHGGCSGVGVAREHRPVLTTVAASTGFVWRHRAVAGGEEPATANPTPSNSDCEAAADICGAHSVLAKAVRVNALAVECRLRGKKIKSVLYISIILPSNICIARLRSSVVDDGVVPAP